jgi:hypothetical protein
VTLTWVAEGRRWLLHTRNWHHRYKRLEQALVAARAKGYDTVTLGNPH